MITDTNIPTAEDFGFTEILDDRLPYKITGYARGVCPDSANPYGYSPPVGWKITSCTKMPPGTHGVAAGKPVILVYCEPFPATMNMPPAEFDSSIMYPEPTDKKVITGRVFSIPNHESFYIEQDNLIRYSIDGTSLTTLNYNDGDKVVATIQIPAGYMNSIGVDEWGYTAKLIDIRREGETPTQSELAVNSGSDSSGGIDPWVILAVGAGVVGLTLGAYGIYKDSKIG
jgi:hypothetical protein